MNLFFNSQFNYCPLVWMLHSRSVNSKISRLQERVFFLYIVSSSGSLLEKYGTFSIHVTNLQTLATGTFKTSESFSAPVMSELFHQKVNHYDLRNPCEFSNFNVVLFMDKRVYRALVNSHGSCYHLNSKF